MKSTLYSSLLNRLKNKHSKLSTRFHKSLKEGEFQKQRYRKRKNAIERLKSLEKRIHGLSKDTNVKTPLNYKHWAVALALGAVVALSNPAQAQEVQLLSGTPFNVGYVDEIRIGDLDDDGDDDAILIAGFDPPKILINDLGNITESSEIDGITGNISKVFLEDFDGDGDLDLFVLINGANDGEYTAQFALNDSDANFTLQAGVFPNVLIQNDDALFFGDLDGDSDLDLVGETRQSMSPYYSFVTVFNNDGFDFSDTTALKGTYVFSPNSSLKGIIDSDGDTDLDILFTAYRVGTGGSPLQVFENVGASTGSFNDSGAYSDLSSSILNDFDTLDINNDGYTDFISSRSSYPDATVIPFLNNGSGNFEFTEQSAITLPQNNGVRDIQSFDFNSDNNNDFLLFTERDTSFVFAGDGIGGFTQQQQLTVVGNTRPFDLDQDGDIDLFGVADNYISSFDNTAGTLTGSNILTISTSYDIDTLDVDNDGDIDFVTVGEGVSRLWLNDGTGNFTIGQSLGAGATSVAFGNLDGDADMEMIIGKDGDYPNNNGGFEIWDNSGGTLTVVDTIGYGSWSGRQVFIENIDGDADLEIVVFARYEGGESDEKVLRSFDNQGGLVFTEITDLPNSTLGQNTGSMDLGDINGDLTPDAIFTVDDVPGDITEIFLNDGDGTFTSATGFVQSDVFQTSFIKLADFDNDGDLDALTNSENEHKVWLNTAGVFSVLDTLGTTDYVYQSSVGDIDGDGDVDIILGGYETNPQIWLNNGLTTPDFTFDSDIPALADEYAKTIVVDLDADGDNDIILSGYYSGLQVFFNQSAVAEPEVNIQGNGVSIVSGDITPDATDDTDFGTSEIGVDVARTFTIQNLGTADLTISGITLGGDHATDFVIGGIDTPATILSGEDATFTLTFTPSASGARNATIQINSDDSDESVYTFAILGTGQGLPEIDILGNGTSIASGDITPDVADDTDFGTSDIGVDVAKTFTIQNLGTADLTISGVTLGGDHATDFAIGGIDAPVTIGSGADATFTLTFTPEASGARNATIQINNDDSDESVYTFAITGTGQATPEINIVGLDNIDILTGDDTPTTEDGTDFSEVALGSSVTNSFKIQNSGSANLELTSITLSGTNASDFTITELTTPATVSSAGEVSFDIVFNPAAVGTSLATVTIESDDADEGTYTFDLQGTAVTPEINVQWNGVDIANEDSTPSTEDGTDFGSVIIDGTPTVSIFTIQNTGSSDLNINSILLSGTGNGEFQVTSETTPFVITAGQSSSLDITFIPTTSGVAEAIVDIVSDDLDEGTFSFAITGVGQTAQEINVQGNTVDIVSGDNTPDITDGTDLGSIVIGQSSTSEFLIQNTGDAALEIADIDLSGTGLDDFSIGGITLPATVPGNSTATFNVTFTATTIGDATATVTLFNNDDDENNYLFDVTATGKPSGVLTSDSLALVALYEAAGGENWTNNTNWLADGQRVDDWYGITVVDGRITNIRLDDDGTSTFNGNNLIGGIPSAIGDLSELEILSLAGNDLTGEIPVSIGNLTKLNLLYLSSNQLSGSIPTEIGSLTSLEELTLFENSLTGTIPTAIGDLVQLRILFLGDNELTGPLPTTFANLTAMTRFDVRNNSLSGTIPEGLISWTSLTEFGIQNNAFEGDIPAGFAALEGLQVVFVEGNAFTSIPNMSEVTSLTSLNVSGNNLDFADLEPNATVTGLVYAPQNNLNVPLEIAINGQAPTPAQSTTTSVQNEVIIVANTGEAPSNVYDWTLNGSIDSEQTTSVNAIPSMGIDNVGTYQLTVTNSALPDLSFTSDPFDLFATATISVQANDPNTNGPIADRVNAYLFPISQVQIPDENVPDTVAFNGVSGLLNVSSTFEFPEVLLGEYYVAVESVEPFLTSTGAQIAGAYLPTFLGDELLSADADVLALNQDESLTFTMEVFPENVAVGEGVVSGTIEEDFGDDEARIDARRRAAKRKCGLRRKRSGGRVEQNSDEFELIAYGETNDNGEFEYGFLPQGVYRFFVEYPGIPLDESSFVEFEIGETGVADSDFTLAVFASEDGISIELVLGITTDFFTDFSIYPNPTTDLVKVKYDKILSDNMIMELIDMNGNVLSVKRLNNGAFSNEVQMDISEYASGQYLIRFSDQKKGGDALTFRILKK